MNAERLFVGHFVVVKGDAGFRGELIRRQIAKQGAELAERVGRQVRDEGLAVFHVYLTAPDWVDFADCDCEGSPKKGGKP